MQYPCHFFVPTYSALLIFIMKSASSPLKERTFPLAKVKFICSGISMGSPTLDLSNVVNDHGRYLRDGTSYFSSDLNSSFFFLFATTVKQIEVTEATSAAIATTIIREPSEKIEPTMDEFVNFA